MTDADIKIGDVLRIRQWDDMKEEFGASNAWISTPGLRFVEKMMRLCGETFTVADCETCGWNKICIYRSEEGIENTYEGETSQPYWYISAYMLERVDNASQIEIDSASLIDAVFN